MNETQEALIQAVVSDYIKETGDLNPDEKKLKNYIELKGGDKYLLLKLQSLTQKAAHGAKLLYVKTLKHKCAEDEELVYFKKGGSLGCGCVKKGTEGMEFNNPKNKLNTKPTWTKEDDKKLLEERRKRIKNGPAQKKWNNLPPEEKKKYQLEEGKKGIKINCVGSALKLRKIKCGTKVKKHEQGGSLNQIPFYLAGTPKDGIKTNSLKKYTVEDINNYLSLRANGRPLTDFERFLTFRLGLPEKLVTSKFTFPELPSLYNIFSTFKLQHQQESLQKLYKNPEDRIKIISYKNVTKHQKGTTKGGISTVPKVEDTYKKSLKFTHVNNPKYPINTDVVFPFNPLDSLQPKRDNFAIRRTIFYHQNQPNDTIYSETPNYPSLNQKDLKNRFNTAWNLAK